MLIKIRSSLKKLNTLSRYILKQGIRISLLMLSVSLLLCCIKDQSPCLNTTLIRCAAVYPLLTFMVLALSIVGAFLIDIYDKTHS